MKNNQELIPEIRKIINKTNITAANIVTEKKEITVKILKNKQWRTYTDYDENNLYKKIKKDLKIN